MRVIMRRDLNDVVSSRLLFTITGIKKLMLCCVR